MPRLTRPVLARTLLVLAVALALRVFRLDTWPSGLSDDEPYGLRHAARFATGVAPLEPLRLYPQGGASQAVVGGHQPGLYYLWPVTLFRLFGVSTLVWRLSSVIPSLLMVLALYPLGRRAFGERAAFLAALFLAIGRWSASEARWGWHVTAAWGLLAPGLVLFAGALRRGGAARAFASGLLCGLPACFYPSALGFGLVPVPLALLKRPDRRRILVPWLGGWTVGFLPTLVMALAQPDAFLARARAASVFAEAQGGMLVAFLAANAVHYAALLFVSGDPLPWHGVPGTPALDPLTAVCVLLGIAAALRRPRALRSAFVLSLLGAGLALGLLSRTNDAPDQYRIGLTALAAAMAGAVALARTAIGLRRRAPAVAAALAPAVLTAALVLNARTLFVAWPRDVRSIAAFGERNRLLARDVERLAALGRAVAVDRAAVNDRIPLDLALARTPRGFALAGEEADVPYTLGAGPAGAARIEPPWGEGRPRTGAAGTVLYRIRD